MENFRSRVSDRLMEALDESAPFIDDPFATDIWSEFLAPARTLAGAGKRTRALLIAAGSEALGGTDAPIHAGTAAELYQISALVHDDIIDESHTRRGLPAAHRTFADSHHTRHLTGDGDVFGIKSGILLGDFLLSLAALEAERAEARDNDALARARSIFHSMTAETAFGQYLDLRAEFTALNDDAKTAITSSLLVLRHKSARYSVELPLMVGGALAGATDDDLTLLSEIGRPLGIAFQLRDDELGIFGSPKETGKPAGGDITEGKRTVLLALIRSMASDADRAFVDSTLGRTLEAADVETIKSIALRSGAFSAHENMIARYEATALAAAHGLKHAPILHSVMSVLEDRRS